MGFDQYFGSATVVRQERKTALRPRSQMSDDERERLICWIEHLPDVIGGWKVSFDATYGSGDWPGKAPGRRKDRRDMLVSTRRRGFDPDDALWCFRRFMDRVAPHVTWFAAVEPNPDFSGLNPGFHLHAVLAGCDDVFRKRLHALWLEENGLSRVRLLVSRKAAVLYTTKHLVRRGAVYAWKVNDSQLWHHIQEQASEKLSPPDQSRAVRPFGWRKGPSTGRESLGRNGAPLPGFVASLGGGNSPSDAQVPPVGALSERS